MKKAVGLGYFKGIQTENSKEVVSHLQYADDTFFKKTNWTFFFEF